MSPDIKTNLANSNTSNHLCPSKSLYVYVVNKQRYNKKVNYNMLKDKYRAGEIAQLVKSLPCMHKALDLLP